MNHKFLAAVFVLLLINLLNSQKIFCQDQPIDEDSYKNSLELSPMSPFINIYAVQYGRKLSGQNEIILGLAYMNIHYDMGNTNALSLILGYRQFIWNKLHIEYQLWPAYDNFYEKNERKYYKSFDLWNEFRIGYQYDFKISKIPFFASVQWPFGFALYASNKPQSFKDYEKKGDNRFFYKALLIFVGVRF